MSDPRIALRTALEQAIREGDHFGGCHATFKDAAESDCNCWKKLAREALAPTTTHACAQCGDVHLPPMAAEVSTTLPEREAADPWNEGSDCSICKPYPCLGHAVAALRSASTSEVQWLIEHLDEVALGPTDLRRSEKDLLMRQAILWLRHLLAENARLRALVYAVVAVRAVCWAGGRLVDVAALPDLAVTDDGMFWHDHSPQGGDIVCTGPFAFSVTNGAPTIPDVLRDLDTPEPWTRRAAVGAQCGNDDGCEIPCQLPKGHQNHRATRPSEIVDWPSEGEPLRCSFCGTTEDLTIGTGGVNACADCRAEAE